MQLQPGERSILAYFTKQEDALSAVAQLEAMGYNEAQVDRIYNYTRMGAAAVPNSISAMTAVSDNPEHYRSYGPLLAASPTVSGLANEEGAYCTHMVTLVTNSAEIDTALNVLRTYGARV